jgi:SAM-dependent methyltransferase
VRSSHGDGRGSSVLTGERTAPGIWHENYWFRRHEVAYAACRRLVPWSPRTVLDAGSGEGYGCALLAETWPDAYVVGIDYDPDATARSAREHRMHRTGFLRGALTRIPLRDNVIDMVVSLQVIEHIWTPGELVAELARVARPGGTLVLSTPNRETFSPGLRRGQRPDNAYHHREYDAEELVTKLGRWCPALQDVHLFGTHHGERIRRWEESHGNVVTAQAARLPQAWSPSLVEIVADISAADFDLGSPDASCLDLVAVAHLP